MPHRREPVPAHPGDVLGLGRLLGPLPHEPLERRGHVVELGLAGALLPPRRQRPALVAGGVVARERAHEIPAHMAIALRQREAGELRAGREAHLLGGHRDPHPLPGRGQRARMKPLRRARLAEVDRRGIAPHRAVLPAVGVELEHDRPRRGGRVEPDVGEELGARPHDQRLGAAGIEVLGHARRDALEAPLPRLHHAGHVGDDPRGLLAGGLHVGIRRKLVVEPHRLRHDRVRLRIERGRVDVGERRDGVVHGLPEPGQPAVEVGELPLLRGRRQHDRGRRRGDVAVEAGIGRRIEEGVERVELAGRERVELVVVADGALAGEAEPDVRDRGRAVHGVTEEELVVDRSALAGRHVAPREAGGRLLVAAGVRQEVAGDLLDGEAVERHVGVEGLHDPVAVGPHLPLVVEVEAVRVGIAGGVEPVPGHLLAVVGAGEQAIDEPLVGVRGGIGEEDLDLVARGR